MSDTAQDSKAWRVTPDQYLADHPAPHPPGFRRSSRYVTARDGTRLAIDVHLPNGAAEAARFPTLAIFTPYYRRFKLKQPHRPSVPDAPNCGHYRDFFVPQGYAVVIVDVRGTGASFGARQGFRSPAERGDYYDVVDWVVGQPWCDGAIGSTGISYVGAAADFLASTTHPAVKAVMPTSSVWDTYSDHFYPGGLLMTRLPPGYGEMMEALDLDQREVLRRYAYFADPHLEGPAPVDEDADGALLRAAIAEHHANFDMVDFIAQLTFSDSALLHDPGFTSATISPYNYARGFDQKLAHYGVSGWMDGAGYSNATIKRWLSLRGRAKRFLIGPWDHGARTNVSPGRDAVLPRFNLLAETLRFFDHHLKGVATGLERERPIHYFTMIEEAWKSADTWPPRETKMAPFYLAADGTLQRAAPAEGGKDAYRVDFACGTGAHTRHERLSAKPVETYYQDWHGRDARMLTYTAAALECDTELTGHPVTILHIMTSERDGALFAYVEDVDEQGIARYVTEGVLRLIHRRTAKAPSFHKVVGPHRGFKRRDARLMTPGEPAEISFALLPVSWLFRKGHRIRIAFAGADRDHYSRIPAGKHPLLEFHRGGHAASRIDLPLIER